MPRRPHDPIPRALWRMAAILVAGTFLVQLDTSIVNVGLETVGGALGAPLASAQWIVSGYLMALGAAIPITGWLARRVGAARLWLVGLSAFTVVSCLCAAAQTLDQLIVLRVLQGLAGGILIPTGQVVLGQAAGPRRMGRVMSTVGTAVVLAPVFGPVLGGVLVDASWRWLFLVNLPIGLLALAAALRWVPRPPGGDAGPLDLVGLVLVGAGLPLTTYAITEAARRQSFGSATVLITLVVGIAALAGFVARSLRTPTPVLNLRLVANPAFRSAVLTSLFGGAALFGSLTLLPLYFQLLRGESTAATGLLLAGQGVGAALAMRLGGRLTDRVGGGLVSVGGLALAAATVVPLALLPASASLVLVEALLVVRGVGIACSIMPAMSAALAAVERVQVPDVVPQIHTLQRVGGSLGAALFVVLLEDRLAGGTLAAFHATFWWLTAATVAALVPAALLARHERGAARRPAPAVTPVAR